MFADSLLSRSYAVNIESVSLGRIKIVQTAQFLAFRPNELFSQFGVKQPRHGWACLKKADGGGPVRCKLREVCIVGVAFNRCWRLNGVFHALQRTSQDGSKEKVGVDIAAGDAVLNPPCRTGSIRDADGRRAVFISPTDPRWSVKPGTRR